MCSVTEDIEELNIPCSEFDIAHSSKSYSNVKVCCKCENISVVVLQKKNSYCRSCFIDYCNHKFKATIGKSKKIKPDHKILLAYSCGAKSSAMLDMVLQGLGSWKKLLFQFGVVFIDESIILSSPSSEIDTTLINISQKLQESNCCPLLYSPLEMVFRSPLSIENFYWTYSSQYIKLQELKDKLIDSLNSIKSLTSKLDYIECLKKQLLLDIAISENYTHIFVGNSATDLATKFLSQIAVGRGSQVAHNTAFCDTQSKIPICRPMREFLNKEIVFYNRLREIHCLTQPSLITKTDSNSCIQRLTESFVNGLQENFPSTVFTIFRTGGKISSNCDRNPICALCKSPRDNIEPSICSALEALSVSEKVSVKDDESSKEQTDKMTNLFCHGCQIIFNDMDSSHLPPFVTGSIRQSSESEMKEEIQEFLLND